MIQGEVFRMNSTEFMEIVNIPRHTGNAAQVHTLPELTNAEFASLCDPNVTGDHMPENIRPKHLIFISKAWFYILSQSLMPLSTASEESNIQHPVRHAILKLTHGYVFDFEDCFLRTMVQAAELVHQLKPYAPWLMPICNYGRPEDFVARHHPKLFTPPVRDTMNIFRQPNNPFATYVGVRHHVNERNMSKAFQKEVYHFEVGIRTQQMLEKFIEGNQRQMQFLSDEINRVGNIAMNNNHYLRVLKRHSWKGLRKFHSIDKLREARIYKEYPHLQRNFARNDSVDRPNPKIPSLEKIDEVLFVNHAEQIRPDTFSDEDSHSSKNEDDPLDESDLALLQAPMNIEDQASPAATSSADAESAEARPPSPGAANA
jgi:hypothetical protein